MNVIIATEEIKGGSKLGFCKFKCMCGLQIQYLLISYKWALEWLKDLNFLV